MPTGSAAAIRWCRTPPTCRTAPPRPGGATGLVERYECGTVVPFGDPRAAADAVLRLAADPGLRATQGLRGHRGAAESLGWPANARSFVAQLEEWAAGPSRSAHASPATQTPPVPAPAPAVQIPS